MTQADASHRPFRGLNGERIKNKQEDSVAVLWRGAREAAHYCLLRTSAPEWVDAMSSQSGEMERRPQMHHTNSIITPPPAFVGHSPPHCLSCCLTVSGKRAIVLICALQLPLQKSRRVLEEASTAANGVQTSRDVITAFHFGGTNAQILRNKLL